MAAESSENRNVRMMGAEMHHIAKYIMDKKQYINDELYPTIQNVYVEKIMASTNQVERNRIVMIGEEKKREMEETLFNGYDNLLIEINNLLAIKRNRNSAKIMAPVLGSLKMKLKGLDRLLKQYRDVYRPRGRRMRNRLTHRSINRNRSRSPNRNRNRLRSPNRNRNRSRSPNRNRNRSLVSAKRSVRIDPIAWERETYEKGSRGNMTYSTAEIAKMKQKNEEALKSNEKLKKEMASVADVCELRKQVEANQIEFNRALAKAIAQGQTLTSKRNTP